MIKMLDDDRCDITTSDYKNFLCGISNNSVDLMLTDPPYNISRKTGFSNVKKGVKRFSVNMDFGKWDKEVIDLQKLCDYTIQVLKNGGTAIIWYDIWKLSYLANAMKKAKFKMLRLIIWQKTNPVPINQKCTYLSNSREIAIMGVKGGNPTFHSIYDDGVYKFPIPNFGGKRLHSTQKSIPLFREIIEKHSNKGDLVIDPFLGSGTTAVASLSLDRQFMGCDIDAEYVNIAKNRIKYNG